MDVGSAAVLGAVVLGLVSLARSLILGTNQDRVVAVVALVVSVVAVILVAASDFAGEQIVLDRPLSSLNGASQLVVALLLAGVASAGWQGLKAVSNIGENSK